MSTEWQFHGCTLREIYSRLGSVCQATLMNGKVFSGHLYNVDPETRTLFILKLPREHIKQGDTNGRESRCSTTAANEPETKRETDPQQPEGELGDQGELTQSKASLPSTTIPQTERPTMVAIRQHVVKAFSIDTDEVKSLTTREMEALADLPPPFKVSPVDIASRRQSIIAMLKLQRIPVKQTNDQEDDGAIHLLVGSAKINPPYVTSSVSCANKVILERVQAMIREYDFNVALSP
ncbi:hypothetical protein FBU30_008327 [Linnemannia zychae]|nr:hypothetical protein FBU30_008327 [Linnemannia zychae]